MLTRRNFNLGLSSAAFAGLALTGCSHLKNLPTYMQRIPDFGPGGMTGDDPYRTRTLGLRETAACPGLDLPIDFECEVISRLGQQMTGGGTVPDKADGMGSFIVDSSHVALVRNHELGDGGGTTTILYDYKERKRRDHYRSLGETKTNCAGGVTPWGAWLSCEEEVEAGPDHGFVYEVPALSRGPIRRKALRHLGRFNHEAAAVDPDTHIIYMTEDQVDGLFYRFVPRDKDDPLGDGKLQAMVFADSQSTDSRNWSGHDMEEGPERQVRWETLSDHSWGLNDPRKRARRELKAVRFACGEGIHFGQDELYFSCTSGGRIKSGQIMRYRPDRTDETQGTLQLFLESTDEHIINFADNLVIAPNGHIIICEDPYFGAERNYLWRNLAELLRVPPAPCYLRGVTPRGAVYDIARLRTGSELAGACFSPDGATMFVNLYHPAKTLAIRGPWTGTVSPQWTLYQGRATGKAPLP